MNLSLNAAVESNDKTTFPHKLLLTDRHVLRLCKSFLNNSSANEKLSKTQLYKIVHSEGLLDEWIVSKSGLEKPKKM